MTSDYIFTKDVEINKETIHEGAIYIALCTSSNVIGKLRILEINGTNVKFEITQFRFYFDRYDHADYDEPIIAEGKIRKGQIEIPLLYGKTVWQLARMSTLLNSDIRL